MNLTLIAAVGSNGELGKDNNLIWDISSDLDFFKTTTMGSIIVMGKNTFDSLPFILPGRRHIVLSSTMTNVPDDVLLFNDFDELLNRLKVIDEEVFIIGGSSLYEQFLPYANRILLTEIASTDSEASVYFPDFDKNLWSSTCILELADDLDCEVMEYKRYE